MFFKSAKNGTLSSRSKNFAKNFEFKKNPPFNTVISAYQNTECIAACHPRESEPLQSGGAGLVAGLWLAGVSPVRAGQDEGGKSGNNKLHN